MNLKQKFLAAFLLISIIPVVIITLFTYDRYTRLVHEQTIQVASNVFDKAVESANAAIANLDQIAEIFTFYSDSDDSIVDDLKKYTSKDKNYSSYDVFRSNNNIKFICKKLIYSSDYINGIFIFTPSGEVLGYGYGGNIDVQRDFDPAAQDWYRETMRLEGQTYIDGISRKTYIINSKPSITFTRALYDVYSHEFLGILMIDCSPSVFDLSRINTMPETAMLTIENRGRNILYTNVDDVLPSFSPQGTQVMRTDLNIDGLTLISAINFEKLYAEFGFTRILIIVIALICTVVIVTISFLLSNYLTKPIIYLSRKMSARTAAPSVSADRYLGRTDEIGILYNEYNRMLEQQEQFIKREYQNKLITLDSQMKSLEAQINSHFLYNTLESINSIAEIEEVESISIMCLALGDMFRYSIKTTSELVSVCDELKHVENYVAIQRIRFDNQFRMEIDIARELMDLKVLKLILQPIVENALYHGLKYCQYGSLIRIIGRLEMGCIYFEISDDGIGMDGDRLASIRDKLAESAQFKELGHRNKQSIGLKNIHSRIELYYGQGYGLSIDSQPKSGTTLTIRLPLLSRKEV